MLASIVANIKYEKIERIRFNYFCTSLETFIDFYIWKVSVNANDEFVDVVIIMATVVFSTKKKSLVEATEGILSDQNGIRQNV